MLTSGMLDEKSFIVAEGGMILLEIPALSREGSESCQ